MISWNILGAFSSNTRHHVRDLIKTHNPYVFCVYEIHVQFTKVEKFWSFMNYKPIDIQESRGNSGGIWIFSCVGNTTTTILDNVHRVITFLIQRKDEA